MKSARVLALAVLASFTGLHPAHADTIAATIKPWFVGGGIVAGALFLLFGWLLIRRGLGTRRIARESANWPMAAGQILDASVRTEMRGVDSTGRYEVFIPQARYAYAVAGIAREGTIIRIGVDQFGYRTKALAEAQLVPYAIGSAVPVRYDPADPTIAVLEAAEYGGARNIFGGAILLGLAIGAFVFAVWSSNLTPT